MEECRKGLRVESPASAARQTAFPGRKSEPAALNLLRDTKAGRMVTLAPPEEEGEWEGLEIELWPGEAKGQGVCDDKAALGCTFPYFFLCFLPPVPFSFHLSTFHW